jgi:hypothetical protein
MWLKALEIIQTTGLRLNLNLNIRKTKIFWPLCDGNKLHEGLYLRTLGGQPRGSNSSKELLVEINVLSRWWP